MRVGVFDSGVGGLTVLKCLLECKPNNEYIYIGDTKNMPFGNKSKEELNSISESIIRFLEKERVDVIIIACGTISSTIYNEIKDKYKTKILDIISPTINYLNSKKYNNIGVIGTVNTINSNVFKNVKCSQLFVKTLPRLASLIETNDKDTNKYVSEELEYFKDKNIDILVLGCTHYPLVENYEYEILNMGYPIVDLIEEGSKHSLKIYFTKIDDEIKSNVKKILNEENIEEITL